jgi:hypothetical protein
MMLDPEQKQWLFEREGESLYIRRNESSELHDQAIRPSTIYRPSLSIDGNRWCAFYGSNLQDGVAGFGVSPEEAYADFDRAWVTKLPEAAKEAKP